MGNYGSMVYLDYDSEEEEEEDRRRRRHVMRQRQKRDAEISALKAARERDKRKIHRLKVKLQRLHASPPDG